MRLTLPALAAALALGSIPALADHDRREETRASGLYDRISAHYAQFGKDVRERFRDGPCTVRREWRKNGDYSESIRCRGPRRD